MFRRKSLHPHHCSDGCRLETWRPGGTLKSLDAAVFEGHIVIVTYWSVPLTRRFIAVTIAREIVKGGVLVVALLATTADAGTYGGSITCSFDAEGNVTCTECHEDAGRVTCMNATVDPEPLCVGDCNRDRRVSIEELTRGVQIELGERPASDCVPLLVCDFASHVPSINCLVAAVDAALAGCPESAP